MNTRWLSSTGIKNATVTGFYDYLKGPQAAAIFKQYGIYHPANDFKRSRMGRAVLLSLKVSSLAVVLSLPFGIFISWLLVRRNFPGKALLDSIIHLPLVLPPVVVGVPAVDCHGEAWFYRQLAI
ncbi:Molybdenum transport system permease protein modB [Raoultella planticola]|uniref:Molybdenum transport system permease protein modB n=1 Tax=Raoultella planticola TaxID=575 RepID=A0A485AVT6_RAOPL|nr:Molybdenum transport system permease protein modB [Raoultella planticola]